MIRNFLESFTLVLYVITALFLVIDGVLLATMYYTQALLFMAMHAGYVYASFSFYSWSKKNCAGTRANIERSILVVMVLSAIIWVVSLGMMYNIFLQYAKTAIKVTWVMTKLPNGTFQNTTAPDKQLIDTNNAMHKWTQNL